MGGREVAEVAPERDHRREDRGHMREETQEHLRPKVFLEMGLMSGVTRGDVSFWSL